MGGHFFVREKDTPGLPSKFFGQEPRPNECLVGRREAFFAALFLGFFLSHYTRFGLGGRESGLAA